MGVGSFLTRYRQESIWDRRGAAAFVLAPLAPVLAYSLFTNENFLGSLLFGAAIAYAHVLMLGLPLTAWVNLRRRISLLNCTLGSTFIGMLPWLLFMGWSLLHGQGPMGSEAIVAMIFSFCFFGGMGCIAGVTWWWIACYKNGPVAV